MTSSFEQSQGVLSETQTAYEKYVQDCQESFVNFQQDRDASIATIESLRNELNEIRFQGTQLEALNTEVIDLREQNELLKQNLSNSGESEDLLRLRMSAIL